ncbi:MAG: APC family permease [Chloroflexi bacterium]|nr:APC family permease [Chloroflexota bacterium]
MNRRDLPNGFHKPGDRIYRPKRAQRFRLRKVLGIAALFSAGYGNVGSSIYYALGIVALIALGATPIALGIAGVIFIFNALTYAEGSAMLPEAGGSAGFARRGISDVGGFIGGWALTLSYITTIAVSAYTVPPYLSYFLPAFREPVIGTATSMGIILLLMLINVIGIRESAGLNVIFIIMDIATQVALVVIGFVLILWVNPGVLFEHMFGEGNWPSPQNLILSIAIAALAFTGVETVSQMAQEARHPAKMVPRAYIMMTVTVLVLFSGISLVALSAMSPQVLGDPVNGWARDPVAGIAANLPSPLLQDIFEPLVAILASSILLTATNAGLIGISRLAYNLSLHQQLPAAFSRIHAHFRTPYVGILFFCVIAAVLMIPGFFLGDFFADLGALYAFGSLLSFAIAHAAILSMRIREPKMYRPFKLGWNLRVGDYELPVTAILGLFSTLIIWVVLTVGEPFTRLIGLTWMAVGLTGYFIYRRRNARRPPAAPAPPPAAPPRPPPEKPGTG